MIFLSYFNNVLFFSAGKGGLTHVRAARDVINFQHSTATWTKMSSSFRKVPLKYSFIAISIIVVYILTIIVHRPISSSTHEPKPWDMKRVDKSTKQTSLGPWKNDSTKETLSDRPIGPWKVLPILPDTRNIKDKSKPYSKSVDHVKKEQSFILGDCYRYHSHGKQLLPSATLKKNHCQKRLPKAVIIGVKKCGTMTLLQYMQLHTSITINGETQFPGTINFTAKDVSKWKDQMYYSSPRTLPMTETSGYILARVESKRRLKGFLDDDLKIIVIIRDPITRAVSDYVHKLSVVFEGSLPRNASFPITYRGDDLRQSIKDTIIDVSTGRLRDGQQLVRFGQYITDLRGLMEVYSRDQLLILDGEAFIEDPLPSLQRVETFLGVPKFYKRDHFRVNPQTGFYCAHVPERPFYHCANPRVKGRPHPTLDDDSEEKLRDYYRPFNLQLAREFDLDFPWLFQ